MGMNEKKAILKLLYKRLRNEFETYQHWLMGQPKKEILRLAPDYLVRKAIIEAAKSYANDIQRREFLAAKMEGNN